MAMLLAIGASAKAQGEKKYSVYAVGFYNLENLFDTCHDAGKNDYEYLPDGSMKWNGMKYSNKLRNMARVLADMGTDLLPNVGCTLIGVSEVENAKALTDLTAQEALAPRGYKYCHTEGEDARGVDCALLYNPRLFTVRNVKLLPYVQTLEKDSAYKTRGFLTVSGTLGADAALSGAGVAWVHSRTVNGKTHVSSQRLVVDNDLLEERSTADMLEAATRSYGGSTSVFIRPDGTSGGTVAGGGSPSGGGEDDGQGSFG